MDRGAHGSPRCAVAPAPYDGTVNAPEPLPTASAEQLRTGRVSRFFVDVMTIPNAITLVRLMLLPVFLWLLFGRDNRQAAGWLLGSLCATDWVDGYVARRYQQVSEFGKVFDPTVDRLLFFVATTAILIDGAMPVWFGIVVLAREFSVGMMMIIATVLYQIPRIDVTTQGKLATFLLMLSVPSFLMANSDVPFAVGFEILAWGAGVPGLVLSLWTGIAYIPKVRAGLATARTATTFPADR